jgi:uncharacterized protein (TIGR02145 family)
MPSNTTEGYSLLFNASMVAPGNIVGNAWGVSIRCVKNVPPPVPEPVKVGGVEWAQSNLNMPDNFAPTPDSPGFFYQWGQSTPWSNTSPLTNMATEEVEPEWPTGYTNGALTPWPAATDPCPKGWRLPTNNEFKVLNDTAKVTATWVAAGTAAPSGKTYAMNGYEFADLATPANVVFFPAVGRRSSTSGVLGVVNSVGNYWSGTPFSSPLASRLLLDASSIDPGGSSYDYGFSIRCVR